MYYIFSKHDFFRFVDFVFKLVGLKIDLSSFDHNSLKLQVLG